MTTVPDDVKGSRSYRSTKRADQAAATRAEIVTAAHRLFVAQGYVRTTLADVAEAAGVAVPTVKLVFGNKRSLLLAAWDRAVKSGPDPRPVAEQEWFQDILAAPDAHEHLRRQAMHSRKVKERIAPLVEAIRAAAASDAEIETLWTTMQSEFHDNQRETIRALQRKGQLREGLTEDSATDLLYTLNHPTLYHMLVVQLGWPGEQYTRWLADTLIEQLLAPKSTPR
ncbi:TetR/AcrR family transcriptional regulator [Nocardia suismassiliense]|uniref:TetR/AcrR family transcriptional regulator n=1 Tax=Nocardia suismassiliense TaxID=2077092 RepID=UPI000D1E1999|nr:TetR/AcrR family transcriptional regulator [Nocardia suismassiliense]